MHSTLARCNVAQICDNVLNELAKIPVVTTCDQEVLQISYLKGLTKSILHQFFYHCDWIVRLYSATKTDYIVSDQFLDTSANKVSGNVLNRVTGKVHECSFYILNVQISSCEDILACKCVCSDCGFAVMCECICGTLVDI